MYIALWCYKQDGLDWLDLRIGEVRYRSPYGENKSFLHVLIVAHLCFKVSLPFHGLVNDESDFGALVNMNSKKSAAPQPGV